MIIISYAKSCCSFTLFLRPLLWLYHYFQISKHSLMMEKFLERRALLPQLFLLLVGSQNMVSNLLVSYLNFYNNVGLIAVLNVAFVLSVLRFLIIHVSLVAANTTTIEARFLHNYMSLFPLFTSEICLSEQKSNFWTLFSCYLFVPFDLWSNLI